MGTLRTWLKEKISSCKREVAVVVVRPRSTLSSKKNGTSSKPLHPLDHLSKSVGLQSTRPSVPSFPKTALWAESLKFPSPTSKTNAPPHGRESKCKSRKSNLLLATPLGTVLP